MSSTSGSEINLQRQIPSVDLVLKESVELVSDWGHRAVSDAIRTHLGKLRHPAYPLQPAELAVSSIRSAAHVILAGQGGSGLKPVFNLTGVVLHTNLGRACLPTAAAQAATAAATQANNLEFDLKTGKRGNRDNHIESLICELTGAEAATVVNNNAAAVVLTLNTLAQGKEVPVSRGELVEIGGSFRMPDVMVASGCRLVEVGATNRTHLKDYRAAITDQTALLMKVHTSNYRVEGFTHAVDGSTLASLAHEHDLPCIVDLGSGCLIDLPRCGLPAEPKVSDYLDSGIDLVTFSGDKLLGGPQCGIIAGGADCVARINKNPLKRALRIDSMIIAALAETLKLYRHPETLQNKLPTLRQLTREPAQIESQALRIAPGFSDCLPANYQITVQACFSQIGSGALPVETIPSFALAISSSSNQDSELRRLLDALRELPKPVIGRLRDRKCLLDLRCLEDEASFMAQLPLLKEMLPC